MNESLTSIMRQSDNSHVHIGKDVSETSYSIMPIDQFGKNILSKLGWKEGTVIGKNQNNTVANIKEPAPRPKNLGLGAKPHKSKHTEEYLKKASEN
jgi:hypothetical protein